MEGFYQHKWWMKKWNKMFLGGFGRDEILLIISDESCD